MTVKLGKAIYTRNQPAIVAGMFETMMKVMMLEQRKVNMEAKETVMSDEQISEAGDKWRHTKMEIDRWLRWWDRFLCEAETGITAPIFLDKEGKKISRGEVMERINTYLEEVLSHCPEYDDREECRREWQAQGQLWHHIS